MWPRCCQLGIPLKDLEWKEVNERPLNSLGVIEKLNISKVLVDLSTCTWGYEIFLQAQGLPLEQGCGWALLLAALILGDVASKMDSPGLSKDFVSYLMSSNKLFSPWSRLIVYNINLYSSCTTVSISLRGHRLNFIYFQNHHPLPPASHLGLS